MDGVEVTAIGRSAPLDARWDDELFPSAIGPDRRAALLAHARDEIASLGVQRGRVVLYRHAYFRLRREGRPPRVPAMSEQISVYREDGVLLARVETDNAGPPSELIVAEWADDVAPDARARFFLGTKAQTLERLHGKLTSGVTLPQVIVTREAWSIRGQAVLDQIEITCSGATEVIVRSSAQDEDSWHSSNAGSYKSVYGVPLTDREAVGAAIEEVFDCYSSTRSGDEVLVQPALRNVLAAGVVTTREVRSKAPYYVISCDDTTGRTDTVTGGRGPVETVYVARDRVAHARDLPDWVDSALSLAKELEQILDSTELDIEFARTAEFGTVLLQVRHLSGDGDSAAADAGYAVASYSARSALQELQQTWPSGDGTHLSAMSDWNPAEMIGRRPRPLAMSLYEFLITDEVWAQSRARLGYRPVESTPLMRDVGGYAFIDVRASLTSFVPSTVTDETADHLVTSCLEQLAGAPQLHDKIEFDVVTTCLDLGWPRTARRLLATGVTEHQVAEIESGLRAVTIGTLDVPTRAAAYLERSADFRTSNDLDGAVQLLGFVRREGTPTFADAARAGFVAMSFIRSLLALDLTTPTTTERFMRSLTTVSDQLIADGGAVANGTLRWESFVERYGHLRPGTYDIESSTYASDPERYLRHFVVAGADPSRPDLRPWPAESEARVAAALERARLGIGPGELAAFIRTATELREQVKFDFTRHLSRALELLAEHYEHDLGISRSTLSYLRLSDLLPSGASARVDRAHLLSIAASGSERIQRTAFLRVPEYVSKASDLDWFRMSTMTPNFVGHGQTEGPVRVVNQLDADLDGAIVVIEAADPGFDWIFGHSIRGLITCYGGVNSHMAIRAAELAIPAAIGVGERMYDQVVRASVVNLDCGAGRIVPL